MTIKTINPVKGFGTDVVWGCGVRVCSEIRKPYTRKSDETRFTNCQNCQNIMNMIILYLRLFQM